jgi:hypothetical protein
VDEREYWKESYKGHSSRAMMLSRPKPGESEVDLLRFQSQFLEAGAAPAVQLVKGSRRHGDAPPDRLPPQDHRDVVMLDSECFRAWA